MTPENRSWVGDLLIVAIGLTLLLFPFPVALYGTTPSTGFLDRWVVIPLFAVPLGLACVLSVAIIGRLLRQRALGVGSMLWLILAGVMSVAFAAHPSPHGLLIMVGIWGIGAVAVGISAADNPVRRLLMVAAVGAAGIEAVWAIAQRVNGDNLGLGRIGESAFPFRRIGTGLAPSGSLAHPYYVAGLSLVGTAVLVWFALAQPRPARWAVPVALVVAPVGLTYSRSAAIGGLALGLCAVWAATHHPDRRSALLIALALAVGVAIPAAIWPQGWQARTAQAASGQDVTSERSTLQRSAIHLIREAPVLGVGPGRYQAALQRELGLPTSAVTSTALRPVHDEPLLIGAEAGLAAMGVAIAFLAALGWRAWRAGATSLGLYLGYLPYWLFDRLPTDHPQGAVITGVWLGFLEVHARISRRGRAPS